MLLSEMEMGFANAGLQNNLRRPSDAFTSIVNTINSFYLENRKRKQMKIFPILCWHYDITDLENGNPRQDFQTTRSLKRSKNILSS